jgi:PIN domain nuclease of toxin-antitoxin system
MIDRGRARFAQGVGPRVHRSDGARRRAEYGLRVILLDTHALLWWVADPKRIPREATRVIDNALRKDEMLAVSSFSVREIALLGAAGRIRLRPNVDIWIEKVEALPVLAFYPVDTRIARRSVSIQIGARDPADRIIVATAIENDATLITGDKRLRAAELVKTVWD